MRICRMPDNGNADISAKFRLLDSLKIQEHASSCGIGGLHTNITSHSVNVVNDKISLLPYMYTSVVYI